MNYLTCLHALWCLITGQVPHAAAFYLALGFGPGPHYVDVAYSDPPKPPGDYVFFGDEPIEFVVNIVNPADQQLTLLTNTPYKKALAPHLFRIEASGASTELAAEMSIDEPIFMPGDGDSWGNMWTDRIRMGSGNRLVSVARLTSPPLTAGFYKLSASTSSLGCLTTCEVRAGAPFRFEVRPFIGAAERLDRLNRQATEAMDEDRSPELFIAEMLRLSPTSSLAFAFRGQYAARLGRWDEAVVAYQRAVNLLESGQDKLLRVTPAIPELTDRLRQDLQDARTHLKIK